VYLTLEEVKKMAATKCSRAQAKNSFLFGCFTGMRISDIKKLEWKDIEDGYISFIQKKTGNAERLPLSAQAKLILDEQKRLQNANSEKVFSLPHRNAINSWLKNWAKRAGITKRISFHKSRHTFATLSLISGIDLYTTSKLLGHRDLRTTQIYARVVDEMKVEAVTRLPLI